MGGPPFAGVYKFVCVCVCVCFMESQNTAAGVALLTHAFYLFKCGSNF